MTAGDGWSVIPTEADAVAGAFVGETNPGVTEVFDEKIEGSNPSPVLELGHVII